MKPARRRLLAALAGLAPLSSVAPCSAASPADLARAADFFDAGAQAYKAGGYLVAEKDGEEIVFRVTSIAGGKAVLDGNHELAGQRLRFDATIVDVRPATTEEITHGHVHGAHGHHH